MSGAHMRRSLAASWRRMTGGASGSPKSSKFMTNSPGRSSFGIGQGYGGNREQGTGNSRPRPLRALSSVPWRRLGGVQSRVSANAWEHCGDDVSHANAPRIGVGRLPLFPVPCLRAAGAVEAFGGGELWLADARGFETFHLELDIERIAAGEAGVAEVVGGLPGGLIHAFEAEVAEAIGADVLADLFNGVVGGDEFGRGRHIHAEEAGRHDRRRGDAHMDFGGAGAANER